MERRLVPAISAAIVALTACASGTEPVVRTRGSVVYGADDRLELFEVQDTAQRATMAASMVALAPRALVADPGQPWGAALPTAGDLDDLCPGEPFADQPAIAFCSGVLVDWNLVLTAGHCARVLAVRDIVAVLGYSYAAPGQLGAGAGELYDVAQIVGEALDPAGQVPRLDFAWFRLSRPVRPPFHPVRVYRNKPPLALGDPLITMSAGAGLPIKLDAGGRVQDARPAEDDYFLADTDTFHGSSGGGVFDAGLTLVGVVARGGTDYTPTPENCNATIHQPDGTKTEEQLTYVHRAVASLCAADPASSSICRADCGDPCEALPLPADTGCAVGGRPPTAIASALAVALIALTRAARRRRT